MATPAERQAMREAVKLAKDNRFAVGANPRVGCVILDAGGRAVGEGCHLGAGTDHAEVVALAQAGAAAAGGTAVVTLEPCSHHGRTPPCTQALIAAGISRVVFGQHDPNPIAQGGARILRDAGIQVVGDVLAPEVYALNSDWTTAVGRGRPFVTVKIAATLDGFVAAADGSSRWISSEASRRDAHAMRAAVDAVLVGTGTALSDDPLLTDRRGEAWFQPVAAVMGFRDIPSDSRLGSRQPILYKTHDPAVVLEDLQEREIHQVLVEGGPTIAAAFLRSGYADRVVWYLSPKLLGEGRRAVDSLGVANISDAFGLRIVSSLFAGEDIRIELEPLTS